MRVLAPQAAVGQLRVHHATLTLPSGLTTNRTGPPPTHLCIDVSDGCHIIGSVLVELVEVPDP
jgi:hypothetical protein